MALFPLDGPSTQAPGISLTNSIVVEVGGGSPLSERKVITIQPLDGNIWVYFGDGTNTPNAATVAAGGFKQSRGTLQSYEAAATQPLFIIAITNTVDVRIVERA